LSISYFSIIVLPYKKKKPFSKIAKGLEIDELLRQDDFRNFCMSEETEKVYRKLEKVIEMC